MVPQYKLAIIAKKINEFNKSEARNIPTNPLEETQALILIRNPHFEGSLVSPENYSV